MTICALKNIEPNNKNVKKRPLFPKKALGLSGIFLSLLLPADAFAFLYPYDFGSFYDQPRGMVNNAALLYHCERSFAAAGRLRSNDFQPRRSTKADNDPTAPSEANTVETEPTDGNAIEAEVGLCHHELDWLSLGIYSAFSSFDSTLSTQSEQNPIVFPLQKTYLPVISGAFSITLIENVHVGLAAQFFETVDIDATIIVSDELRATVDTRISMTFNWNIGAALETDFGILHAGYQPAFEADIDFEISAPIDLTALNLPFNVQFDDLFSLEGALDYRPATWQLGWIGDFGAQTLEIGALISEWDRLGSGIFISINDPFGAAEFLFTRNDIVLEKTVDPYIVIQTEFTDEITLYGGYAFFNAPIVVEDDKRWAVSGDIHSLKAGIRLKTEFRGKPVYLEGQMIYGYMPEQEISGDGLISGGYIAGMGQISFPF